MKILPRIMVAPNGARRTKADHPNLPVTINEVVACARDCAAAGADGIHIHVRDDAQKHVLDAGQYREVLSELELAVPDLYLQITTEAVGQYSPAEQIQLVRDVQPTAVSVALSELLAEGANSQALDFYEWANVQDIAVQHILYSDKDFDLLEQLLKSGVISKNKLNLLFVLGRYAENQESHPRDLEPFLSRHRQSGLDADWAICAFGAGETDCLVAAFNAGGKIRIGFENSLWHSDGTLATSNAERITHLQTALNELGAS